MSENDESEEAENLYDEVRRLEGHIEHVNEKIADLGIEQGDTADELQEKGLSATEIRAATRYTKLMTALANEVQEYHDETDSDYDDGSGSSFKVDGTLR